MLFYVGLHHPGDGKHFDRAFISVNTIRNRKSPIGASSWIMDSGAFSELSRYGCYRHSVEDYAAAINRWAVADPRLVAAVAQDYMCEPWIVEKTGLSIAEHQRLTIERYDALLPLVRGVYVMPVLQGYAPADYVSHVRQYGSRLGRCAYVGVGSICKRNANYATIEDVLLAIKRERSDLNLHGFGVKLTSLASGIVQDCLYSADSMAWSYGARMSGRNGNDWREAAAFVQRIEACPVQNGMVFT
jgi:hypothetical protein